ncbi:fatty acyl-AMP ligase, partial [Bradyrhizobium sp. PRIMUS42]|uniref:fatty acyl-AMP ligase n=1 Tax=Bradyrhizobium sp. PRIMUS42 TaxID=2908926 RepID=UPI001FF4305F
MRHGSRSEAQLRGLVARERPRQSRRGFERSPRCSRRGLGMTEFRTIQEVLARRAEQEAERVAFRFLDDAGAEDATFTNGRLLRKAGGVASILRENGLRHQRVALVYQKAEHFVCAFFGTLAAGSTVVPLSLARMGFAETRLALTFRDAQIAAVLTDSVNYMKVLDLVRGSLGGSCKVLLVENVDESLGSETIDIVDGETTAVIQYTSGSTSVPKGVEISHANLLHNASMLIRASVSGLRDMVGLNWLPLFHDNGLMWGAVLPVYGEMPVINISPAAVIARPANWFRAISDYKVNISGGPNFIYDLCVERLDPEKLPGVDLKRWEIAFCGAEPIRSGTVEQFLTRFARLGLSPECFLPGYGLAEATLMVSMRPRKARPIVRDWNQDALEKENCARPWTEGRKRTLVSSGQITEGQQVAIVDPNLLQPCHEGRVGEIWVSGPSVAKGYWRRPDETKLTFGWPLDGCPGASFMRTGDLGFLDGGELFVVGRIKDLIIIRGTNYYPQDIELTVERTHPEFRKNGGAAFSVEIEGREELVVLQELKRGWKKADTSNCLDACRTGIAREHGLSPCSILLVAGGAIPKTSSGKVQRRLARTKFLEGAFSPVMQWSSRDPGSRAGRDAGTGGVSSVGGSMVRGSYVAPRSATEEVLARIWGEVLGLERVGA